MKKILVTGGAGYIGSFMVRALENKGYNVTIVDDLSSGHRHAVKDFRLEQINLLTQKDLLNDLFAKEKFDGVIHMAAFIQMGESFVNPSKYYRNNVMGFLNLMDSMRDNGCTNIIISSSAGVYGNPQRLPIEEDDPKNPLNPYGETKYMMERICEDYEAAHGIKFVSLRYFNASGAALDGSIGEAHPEESHLIPNVISSVLSDKEFTLFGDDYQTPDGTCIRDYVHVLDLSDSHVLALESILGGGKSDYYNIGLGKGYSNKEVISQIEEVSGKKVRLKIMPKRPGDANALYAKIDKIKNALGWSPKYGIKEIIESAYKWHLQNKNGYSSI